MRDRPDYLVRSGSPDRARYVRARRVWVAIAGVGALVCVTATVSLASPVSGGPIAPSPSRSLSTSAPTTDADRPSVSDTTPVALAPPPTPGDRARTPPRTTEPVPTQPAPTELSPTGPPTVPLAGVPTEIRLGDAGSAIPVIPIGVSPDGVLDPPADITTAGWWVAGPRPGGPGRTVITGHIDSREAGLGAFAALDAVNPGDRVTVATADSRVVEYVVTARDEVEKSRLDPAILRGTTASDLLLITCIGVFDDATRSYESNLLITASPVADPRHPDPPR